MEEYSDNNPITFIKLKNDSKTEIRYIYHLSDIHIRNTQRHAEYQEVFDRTYRSIKKSIGTNDKVSMIVLTGDIMHSKTELSPEAINIAFHFFQNLSLIAPLIVIAGNHDCNLSNKNRLDAISPIVEDIGRIENLHYLRMGGIYQYHNIVFGVTSIFNRSLVPAKKIGRDVWRNIRQGNKYKIALYHGPVHGARTDVGYRMNNTELLVGDFVGYDYVMLGDIHKHQYLDKDLTVAYAGSLIQQSHGETLDKHGILKWDLLEATSELLEIKNDYGFCTVRIVDGAMVPTENRIPPKPKIRFVLENTNQIQYQDIVKSLEADYEICEIVKESNFRTGTYRKSREDANLALDTQETIIKGYLEKKVGSKEKIDSVMKLHQTICQKKEPVSDVRSLGQNQRWCLLKLNFSNTLSYGKDNVINFQNYDPNKIIGIIAPNHFGKSAILDIILFCLFDRMSRGERRDILNKNQKHMQCSLEIRVGKQHYLIERIGDLGRNGLTIKIDVNFYLVKFVKGKKIMENLSGIDKNETNRKIAELVGSYHDYLASCFCLQQCRNTNFIDMTESQKKEYLNQVLKLNVFEDCHRLAKNKTKKLSVQLKMLEQQIGMKGMEEMKNYIKTVTKEIASLKAQCQNSLSEELNYIIQGLKPSPLLPYSELNIYDLGSEQKIGQVMEQIRLKLNTKSDSKYTSEQLFKFKSQLKALENATCPDIDALRWKREILVKKLINVKGGGLDIELLERKKAKAEDRVKELSLDDANCSAPTISELNLALGKLRKSLGTVEPNWDSALSDSSRKLLANNQRILELVDKFGLDGPETSPDVIRTKKSFIRCLNDNIRELRTYERGLDRAKSNDRIITRVLKQNMSWMEKERKCIRSAGAMHGENVEDLVNYSAQLAAQIRKLQMNFFIESSNELILKQISKAEVELDAARNLHANQRERDLLLEQVTMFQNQISEERRRLCDIESNGKIQQELDEIQAEIDAVTKAASTRSDKMENLRQILLDHKSEIKLKQKLRKDLHLVEEYYLSYMCHQQKMHFLEKWTQTKKESDEKLDLLSKEIRKKEIELEIYKKDLEQYLDYRKDYDKKLEKANLYQLYTHMTNYNGLPYEILKTYLPLIESDVNQILHSMVDFSIEFLFYDEETTGPKTNAGCVAINIRYQNMKPCRVQLASGFERFIIGLAIRIAIGQISLVAKPNFLIIDEGWSCLDTENRNNISHIMDFIKTQYEHVIIISHLEELKNQADYIINIEREGGYSFVRT